MCTVILLMRLDEVNKKIANILKDFDSTYPVFKNYKPGIGPFGEPQLVSEISRRLNLEGMNASTHRTPDLRIGNYAIEIKIVRPFGDNGKDDGGFLSHFFQGCIRCELV